MKISHKLWLSKDVVFKAFQMIVNGEYFKGENVKNFEDEFKSYIGTKYAIAASSGRFALYLILNSLDIKKDIDEIILPSYAPWILGKVSIFCGLKPVFVDIDPETNNMSPKEIEKKISKNTKIILMVHLYGMPCNIEEIVRLAKKYDIVLIEDCAQAVGARYKGKKVGSFGDISFFSFGVQKMLNTYGGGMIVTDNHDLYEKIRKEIDVLPFPKKLFLILRVLFISRSWLFATPLIFTYLIYPLYYLFCITKLFDENYLSSITFKFSQNPQRIKALDKSTFVKGNAIQYTNLQAIIGLMQLKKVDKNLRILHRNAKILEENLKNTPSIPDDSYPAYFLFCHKVENRKKIIKNSFRRGIILDSGHYLVLSDLDVFKDYKCDCPNARDASKKIIYIPIQPHLGEREMKKIINVLNANI